MNTLVGTYTVNPDCSITMTLKDNFMIGTNVNTVNLEGELMGDQIELVVTGANAAGARVTLIKTQQFSSCSNSMLSGTYGLVGSGILTSAFVNTPPALGTGNTTPTTTGAFVSGITGTLGTPFNVIGRFDANGTGTLTKEVNPLTSPLSRQLIGTYTVNVDCTGTATLIDETNAVRSIRFVLVNEAPPGVTTPRQTLRFVFTDPGAIGDGIAKPQ